MKKPAKCIMSVEILTYTLKAKILFFFNAIQNMRKSLTVSSFYSKPFGKKSPMF